MAWWDRKLSEDEQNSAISMLIGLALGALFTVTGYAQITALTARRQLDQAKDLNVAVADLHQATGEVRDGVTALATETSRAQRLAIWVAIGTALGGAVIGGIAGAVAAQIIGS